MDEIADWLRSIGMEQYAPAFADNFIDTSLIGELTDQGLKDIGIAALGHRMKILRAAATFGAVAPAAAEREAAPAAQVPAFAAEAPKPSGAERRQLTVMFCDLVGSTALAARLDPEDVREVVRAYQGACAAVITRYEGFVAQYLGDGIMAYFGYPQAHEDDAERAVRAGLDLVAAVAKLDTKAKVEVRVGIATGLVVVGDLIGEHAAKERAVTGETPNLAARLQGLATPGSIVVSAATRRLLGAQFDLRDLGAQLVKGLEGAVQAFAVEGIRTFESRFEARAGGLTGFVGREEECEHLLERWRLARQGRGQVVLVSGEAGIGKSRLTAWLADKVRNETHTRLRYQCTPHHKDSALYPTIVQLERAAGIEPSDAPEIKLEKLESVVALAAGEARDVVPLFASLLAIPVGEAYPPFAMSPGQQRQRTLAAMLDQIEGLARQKPLVMIYEDAHWADATSLELLDTVVDRIAPLPVLCLITGRPEFSPAWAGRHNVSALTLTRLDRLDARAMVESVAGGVALPADLLDQIVAKTDGVPLYVEELTKNVLESGLLVEAGSTYRTAGPLAIPATLQDSLMARLDRSNPVKEIAQIGAAIGREFSYKLLVAVAGLEEATIRTSLAKLEEAELANRRGVPPDATYTFKHALVQDAAYQSLLKSRRQVIHRRIAKALRDRFQVLAESEPEITAHHLSFAGKSRQAADWWTKAGALCARRGAFVEAASHYQRAIAAVDALPVETSAQLRSRLQLQVAYREALIPVQGWATSETITAITRAAELAAQLDDPEERTSSAFGAWMAAYVPGEIFQSLKLAKIFQSNSCKTEIETLFWNGVLLGQSLWASGHFNAAVSAFETVEGMYNAEIHAKYAARSGADIRTVALAYCALALWPLGRLYEARNAIEQAEAHAHAIGDPASIVFVMALAAIYEATRGDLERLKIRAELLLDVSEKNKLLLWVSVARVILYLSCSDYVSYFDIKERLKHELVNIETFKATLNKPLTEGLRADLEGSVAPEIGVKILDNILRHTERTGNLRCDAELHRKRGLLLRRTIQNDQSTAEAALKQALNIASNQRARTYALRASLDLARLYCDTGREPEAASLLQEALVGFEPTPELPEIAQAQELLASLGGSPGQTR